VILLVDNSNTRTKFLICRDGQFCTHSRCLIPTAELTAENISAVVEAYRLSYAVVASVVPRTAELLHAVLQKFCPVCMLNATTPGLPIEFDYPGVATLGADRIANIIAAATHYSLPCIAVDAGTAVTFDVVLPAGQKARFVGGAIAPGMSTMLMAMNQGTALLPRVYVEGAVPPIGRNTSEAIQAGTYWGTCGMVDAILTQMKHDIGEKTFVVATGGDASKIASVVKKIDCIDELLTFRGLWQVAHIPQ